jgi:hypothetical protein
VSCGPGLPQNRVRASPLLVLSMPSRFQSCLASTSRAQESGCVEPFWNVVLSACFFESIFAPRGLFSLAITTPSHRIVIIRSMAATRDYRKSALRPRMHHRRSGYRVSGRTHSRFSQRTFRYVMQFHSGFHYDGECQS